MRFPSCWIVAVLIIAALVLTRCGGSGGDGGEDSGDAPDAPVLTLQILDGETLHFTWTNAAGETRYHLLEDRDGTSGFSQVASTIADDTTHDLLASAMDRLDAVYCVEACNAHGCSRSLPVSVAQVIASAFTYIKASNNGVNHWFGFSVAISGDGDTLAVGATGDRSAAQGCKHPGDPDYESSQADDSGIGFGAVYVFRRTGGTWAQVAYIKAANAEASDLFGSAVALSADGNTLAVGAVGEDSDGLHGLPDNSVLDSGAVYVFTRWAGRWSPEGYLKAQDVVRGAWFGNCVALSGEGDTLAIGAPQRDGGTGSAPLTKVGGAYVFVRDASFWYQEARLEPPVVEDRDQIGSTLALSHDGDVLAVGWSSEDSNGTSIADNSALDAGAVLVFTRSGFTWSTPHYLKASAPWAGDLFGGAVSLAGDGRTLVVGAPGEDSDSTAGGNQNAEGSGAVYVFAFDGLGWVLAPTYVKAPNPDSVDVFGDPVALSANGETFAIAATYEASAATGIDGDMTDNSAPLSGAVYVR